MKETLFLFPDNYYNTHTKRAVLKSIKILKEWKFSIFETITKMFNAIKSI